MYWLQFTQHLAAHTQTSFSRLQTLLPLSNFCCSACPQTAGTQQLHAACSAICIGHALSNTCRCNPAIPVCSADHLVLSCRAPNCHAVPCTCPPASRQLAAARKQASASCSWRSSVSWPCTPHRKSHSIYDAKSRATILLNQSAHLQICASLSVP